MHGCIVMSWAGIPRGREDKALEVFGTAQSYFDDLAKKGRIHDHTSYFSLTGKTGGFTIVTGELDELLRLQTEDANRRLQLSAENIVDDFTVQIFTGGNEQTIGQLLTMSVETRNQLGY